MIHPVLVIYAGGTIGMQQTGQGYAPVSGLEQQLRQRLGSDTPEFDWHEITPLIDSAAAQPADWLRLARLIRQHWYDYAGFVILHGTDTLAYTASALSFLLGAVDKPVVLTGAQIPLSRPRSDALLNVSNSLALAAAGQLHEVSICFHDRVLRGNRSRKLHSQAMAAFDSPACQPLLQLGIAPDWQVTSNLPPADLRFQPQPLPDQLDAQAVAMLMLYPGIQRSACDWLLEQPRLRGLVVLSYGAGNPPTAEDGPLLCLAELVRRDVMVVNVSQCLTGGVEQGSYATGAEFNRIGVLAAADMTPEAAFSKLHWLLAAGYTPSQCRQLWQVAVAGEASLPAWVS